MCRRKFPGPPIGSDWVPPARTLREGDDEVDTESVSSGHSEEMARKRAKRAKAEQAFGARPKKKGKDIEGAGYKISGEKKVKRR